MAKKAESFRVIDRVDKKTNKRIKELVLYSNVIPTEAEKTLIEYYLNNGFKPKTEEKKKNITIEQMREDLKGTDKLVEFENAYKEKEKGFFKACKVYNAWKKTQPKKK